MKNSITLSIFALFVALSFTSCQKDCGEGLYRTECGCIPFDYICEDVPSGNTGGYLPPGNGGTIPPNGGVGGSVTDLLENDFEQSGLRYYDSFSNQWLDLYASYGCAYDMNDLSRDNYFNSYNNTTTNALVSGTDMLLEVIGPSGPDFEGYGYFVNKLVKQSYTLTGQFCFGKTDVVTNVPTIWIKPVDFEEKSTKLVEQTQKRLEESGKEIITLEELELKIASETK